MPHDQVTYLDFLTERCADVSRFVRPFVADAEAARAYVRRTFVRGYPLRMHEHPDPLALVRLALCEVRRACPPRGRWLDVVSASTPLSRAAFLLVHVQELRIEDVACILHLTVGQTLHQAELAAIEVAHRSELASLDGCATVDARERLDQLRLELVGPTWTDAQKTQLAAAVDRELGLPVIGCAALDPSPPFRGKNVLPLPVPPAKALAHRARRRKLGLLHALATLEPVAPPPVPRRPLRVVPPPLPRRLPSVAPSPPPLPAVALSRRPPRFAWSLVACTVFGAIVAQAAPALWSRAVAPRTQDIFLAAPTERSREPRSMRPILHRLRREPPVLEQSSSLPRPPARVARVGARVVSSPAAPVVPEEAVVAPAAAPDPSMSAAPSLAPSTLHPSLGAVSVAFGRVKREASACLATDDAPSRASITFGPAGRPVRIAVAGPAAFTAAKSCIERALQRAEVPAFSDPEFTAVLTLRP